MTVLHAFGHIIRESEVAGIGPLMKRQTADQVQNHAFNPWKPYFQLHLRNHSVLIEGEFYEMEQPGQPRPSTPGLMSTKR